MKGFDSQLIPGYKKKNQLEWSSEDEDSQELSHFRETISSDC